ncbi:MAG: carboxylating nicotinate-nucleotide diphosphorylase [Thermofilaceae archaeon]
MVEEIIYRRMLDWLEEDIPFWDVTSQLIPPGCEALAVVLAKEPGVSACIEEVACFLEKLGFRVKVNVYSGESFERGSTLLEVRGDLSKLLQVERLVLNLLAHACGVATLTRKFVEAVREVNPKVRVAATRKTLPGLRYFEKRAVVAGGGDPHRLSLSDMIMIKDNHLKCFSSVSEAVKMARKMVSFSGKIEVEVTSPEEAVEAVKAGADVVMLDNFTVGEVVKALGYLRREGLRDRVVVEASGGITLENVAEYAKTGVDVISIGALTHSARALDISLEVVEVKTP